MIFENFLELAGETFARAEWVALFLIVVGLYWGSLGYSGIWLLHTRGFGWSTEELYDQDARLAGTLWAAAGGGLFLVGLLVWVLKT